MQGIRVLDLGMWRPIPYATALLAELGAEVTKVEPPGGDPMRAFPDLFAALNQHKQCLTLDLKSDTGRARALELAAEVDVVAEGFRKGVVERLGVGYDDVAARNPTVVYCSLRDDVAGHDVNYQAAAGILSLQPGDEPRTPKVPWADLVAGLHAAFRIAAAVAARPVTGGHLELTMTDVLTGWAATCTPQPVTGRDRPIADVPGYGVYATADGHVALGVLAEDHLWKATCRGLGMDDVAALSFAERLDDVDALQARIAAVLAHDTRAAAVGRLQEMGAPASPVRTIEEL